MTESPRVDDSPSATFLAATQAVLAWRRTALQLAIGAVVAARLLSEQVGPAVFIAGLVGLGAAIAVHASASSAFVYSTKRRGGHVNRRGKARIAHPQVRLGIVAGFAVAVALAALTWMVIQV